MTSLPSLLQVLFKLDKSGEVDRVRLEDLPLNRAPCFTGFDHDNFLEVRTRTDGASIVFRILQKMSMHLQTPCLCSDCTCCQVRQVECA